MPITLHCSHCNKKIVAQDKAGGKWGKCPACHNKIYVPDLASGAEELKLAPVDEQDQAKQKKLMAETYKLNQNILQEKSKPDAIDKSAPDRISDKDLTKNIILYLRQMADGHLSQAETIAASIAKYGRRAIEILDSIALSEIPDPKLTDIPPQVLSGLIRQLRAIIC